MLSRRGIKNIKITPILIVLPFIISVIGILTLLSTEISENVFLEGFPNIVLKQILFVLIGIVGYFILSIFDANIYKLKNVVVVMYFFTLVLLVLTLFFGEERNFARRWISVAGFQLQPSEIAKVVVVILTAYVFSIKKINEWIKALIVLVATMPFCILIYLQPHGSMSLILLILALFSIFISLNNQIRNFVLMFVYLFISVGVYLLNYGNLSIGLALVSAGAVITVFSFFSKGAWKLPLIVILGLSVFTGFSVYHTWNNVLLPYQKDRINVFFNPDENIKTTAFNVNQAKIAIGSGRILGKGWGNGTQSKRNFLPEHQTDFIFASYAEQAGLVGSLVLLFLYMSLLVYIFLQPLKGILDRFFSVVILSLAFKMLIEVFINIGTNTGITPATGIPLPLMSAGGSITLMTFFSLGIIQSIINSKKVDIA